MSSGYLSICFVFVVGTLIISSEATPAEKSCRAVQTDFNRLQFKQIGICSKTLTSKEKPEKSYCILKCVLQNMGLINSVGALSMEQYNMYIKDTFPVSLQTRANSTFSPCLESLVGLNLSTDISTAANLQQDVSCKSYEPFIKCVSKNAKRWPCLTWNDVHLYYGAESTDLPTNLN